MLARYGVVIWLASGAFGLGLMLVAANRRGIVVPPIWYFAGLLLGPIFLAFIVPLWIGRWGQK